MSLPVSTEPVRIVRHPDRVVELRLDDPARGNALDLRTAEALRDTAREVAADPGGTVLLRAAGGSFCVGGDLRAFAGRGAETSTYARRGKRRSCGDTGPVRPAGAVGDRGARAVGSASLSWATSCWRPGPPGSGWPIRRSG